MDRSQTILDVYNISGVLQTYESALTASVVNIKMRALLFVLLLYLASVEAHEIKEDVESVDTVIEELKLKIDDYQVGKGIRGWSVGAINEFCTLLTTYRYWSLPSSGFSLHSLPNSLVFTAVTSDSISTEQWSIPISAISWPALITMPL